jgi:YD repeat-containing protein
MALVLCDETFRFIQGNGRETTFATDGRPVAQSDLNGNRVDYLYDAGKRLIRLQGDGGPSHSLAYDAAGRLLEATGPGGDRVTTARRGPRHQARQTARA